MYGKLYYSKSCQHCYSLMTIMENQGLLNFFELKCIDNMNDCEFAGLKFQKVPTLIIANSNDGSYREGIYESAEAFKWVDAIVTMRRQNAMMFIEKQKRLIEIEETKKRMADGLSENCQLAINGISDPYAYCKDDINLAQPKTFVSAMGMGDNTYRIMTIPQAEKVEKLNENDQKRLIQDLERKRTTQDGDIKTIMSNEQLVKIRNNINMMM